MKLVDRTSVIGRKVHELAWNLHEIEFALSKEVFLNFAFDLCIHK